MTSIQNIPSLRKASITPRAMIAATAASMIITMKTIKQQLRLVSADPAAYESSFGSFVLRY